METTMEPTAITTATPDSKTPAQEYIEFSEKYGTPNYHPLPVVISEAKGVWVKDPEGCKYLDMLSSYSALNHGHRHPEIIKALIDQAKINTLTVLTMEVPCCRGLLAMAQEAARAAGRKIPVKSVVIGIDGEKQSEEWV